MRVVSVGRLGRLVVSGYIDVRRMPLYSILLMCTLVWVYQVCVGVPSGAGVPSGVGVRAAGVCHQVCGTLI